jgi:hypothetical protein
MSEFDIIVFFNEDGTFHHVENPNGDKYNIDAWNDQFTSLDPKNTDVGTKTKAGRIQTNHHDYHPTGLDTFLNIITVGTWSITYGKWD